MTPIRQGYFRVSVVPLVLGLAVAEAAPDIPRPEHPNMQMERSEWLNLNGAWEFAETDEAADERYLGREPYPDKITVPFCRESKLSGLARREFVRNVWYRRVFTIPSEWRSPRVRLHVGDGNMPVSEDEFFARYAGLTNALLDNPHLFGFCYTQLTDVEQERNGIYTFDRQAKFDAQRFHKINTRRAAYERTSGPPEPAHRVAWRVLVGAAPDGERSREWRFVTRAPLVAWKWEIDFDDSDWARGRAAFGQKHGRESYIRTPWNTSDIWMRQTFDYDGAPFDEAVLLTHYDNAAEVYINGQLIWSARGWNDDYQGFAVTDALRKALRIGSNVIAIHCHQDEGGQFIDAAVLVGRTRPKP